MRKSVLLMASMALALVLVSGVALAYPADLDPSFDGDGKVRTAFSPPDDPRYSVARDIVALQDSGKILAAGYAQPDQFGEKGGFASARYNADGSLDLSYGGDGRVVTVAGRTDKYYGGAFAVAVQDNGGIFLGGNGTVVKYDADGTLDEAFGSGGVLTGNFYVCGLEILEGGKLLVATASYEVYESCSSKSLSSLLRYNADGSLDDGGSGDSTPGDAFDADGKLVLPFGRTMAVQADGKILVGGAITNAGGDADYALARYNADGTLDTSFDQDGQLRT